MKAGTNEWTVYVPVEMGNVVENMAMNFTKRLLFWFRNVVVVLKGDGMSISIESENGGIYIRGLVGR